MRERLIELLKQNCHCKDEDCTQCTSNGLCFTHRETDYLLENGVFVSPCKVGDEVYYINSRYEKIGRRNVCVDFVDKGEVDNIVIGSLGIPQINVCNAENEWTLFDSEADFGKIVFLTRKEAEKALKGGER